MQFGMHLCNSESLYNSASTSLILTVLRHHDITNDRECTVGIVYQNAGYGLLNR